MSERLPDWVKLGARVYARDTITRQIEPHRRRVWLRGAEYYYSPNPATGIVVGVRTLSDGHVDDGGYEDEPWTFEPDSHFTALLIATDLRRRVVRAHLEDCEQDSVPKSVLRVNSVDENQIAFIDPATVSLGDRVVVYRDHQFYEDFVADTDPHSTTRPIMLWADGNEWWPEFGEGAWHIISLEKHPPKD